MEEDNMKIFITGATGFIGSHVVRRLAPTEHELRCLVRKSSQISELEELGVNLIMGDLTDRDSLLEGMKGCDWVLDIANVYTFWTPNKKTYTEVNVIGTRNVMESALEIGVSKVVHVSTGAIWGKPSDSPFSEDSPVGPVQFSEYARTKYEGDLIAWELYEKKGLPLVMIYPVAVLGPGDPKSTGQYITNIINRKMPALVLTDAIFTFVHVRDVAEAIVRAAEKENNIGEKYLIGKHQLTFGEISKMVSEISGVPLPKLRLPNFLTTINAALLTLVANIIKKPPLWGMSTDQIRTMKEGARVDGSKAERELGITYTPVRVALEEAIESYRN
jgi:dihydroflavonol-4-reductase